MKTSRGRFFALGFAAAIVLVIVSFPGCSRNSGADIVIQLANPPSIAAVGQAVRLIAIVDGDSKDAGVDWTSTGGTFAPAHTGSGEAAVFTAPASAGNVTVTAAAAADGAVQAEALVSIVSGAENARLNGAYVFSVQGQNASGAYAAVGTVVADGDGHITAGEQDYTSQSIQAGPDALTGVYAIGPDGRGSLMLEVDNTDLPLDGSETFSIALSSTSHGLVIQFDGTASSSGSLDLQVAAALDPAAISGAFAFTAQGIDITNQVPFAYGGALVMSAATGTVSSGTYFENDGGTTTTLATTGTLTAPDAFGRGTIALSVGVDFVYYAVQGRVLRIVGSDYPLLMTGGSMYGQGAAGTAGTFSNASLDGDYVIAEGGGTGFGPLALAGQFAADGAGNLASGFADVNNSGVDSSGSIAGQAAYAISGDGTGTLDLPAALDQRGSVSALRIFLIDPAINLLDPNDPLGGGGALVMDDDLDAVASGYIVPRSAGTFEGDFTLNFQFVDSGGETDWVGRSLASAGALTGTLDINETGATAPAVALTGAFSADQAQAGRWTGTFNASGASHQIVFYQVSGTRLVLVDLDSADIGIGILEKI